MINLINYEIFETEDSEGTWLEGWEKDPSISELKKMGIKVYKVKSRDGWKLVLESPFWRNELHLFREGYVRDPIGNRHAPGSSTQAKVYKEIPKTYTYTGLLKWCVDKYKSKYNNYLEYDGHPNEVIKWIKSGLSSGINFTITNNNVINISGEFIIKFPIPKEALYYSIDSKKGASILIANLNDEFAINSLKDLPNIIKIEKLSIYECTLDNLIFTNENISSIDIKNSEIKLIKDFKGTIIDIYKSTIDQFNNSFKNIKTLRIQYSKIKTLNDFFEKLANASIDDIYYKGNTPNDKTFELLYNYMKSNKVSYPIALEKIWSNIEDSEKKLLYKDLPDSILGTTIKRSNKFGMPI